MTVTAELQFVTDAARVASEAAASVARLRQSLESLAGLSGTRIDLGADVSGQVDEAARGAAKIAEIEAKSAAKLAEVSAAIAGRLAAISASSEAQVAAIEARSSAAISAIIAKRESAAAAAASDIAAQEAKADAAIQVVQAKASADVQRVAAKAQADAQAHQQRVAEQYQKDRNAILVEGARASNALQADELAHRHRVAELEKKGAVDAQKIRIKGEEDRARIAAKAQADAARDARREVSRANLKNRAGAGAMAVVQGGGAQGAASAIGGRTGAAIAIGAAAFGVAAQLADISTQFTGAVIKAQAYREDVAEAFTVVAGSAGKGQAIMQRALSTADKLGASRAETAGQFLDLATKGFADLEIERIVKSLRDLSTIDPNASMEGLTKVIGKAQATGRLNVDILSELSTFGLEQGDVIREIGKMLKKTDQEVLKALSSAGGIRGLGVEPILRAINKQVGGGEAGSAAMAKADRNLSSLLQQVQNIPDNLLFDVQAGPGLDLTKNILRDVIQFFDGTTRTGQLAREVLGEVFTALVEGFTGVDATDKEGIRQALATVLVAARESTPVIKAFASAIRLSISYVGMAVAGWGIIITEAGNVIDYIKTLPDTVVGAATDIGASIIDGITGGITGGIESIKQAATDAATSALQAAKDALGIKSPSRAMRDQVGLMAGEGLAIGYERSIPRVVGAAEGLADAALRGAAQEPFPLALPPGLSGAPAIAGAPLGGGVGHVQFVFAPNITIEAGASSDNEALSELITRKIQELTPQAITAFLEAIAGR